MKFILSAILVLGAFTAASAMADSASDVLESPAITAVYQLFNKTNRNGCRAPQESDIRWFCMGAIPPDLTQPTIVENGCGFAVEIACQNGAKVSIRGNRLSVELVGPNGLVSQATDLGIRIDSVDFNPGK